MYVVAITQLSETQADLPRLAQDLGTTAYELKLLLNAGMPAIVRLTVDVSAAADAVRAIERQGHRVVSADRRSVTPSSAMKPILEPQFEREAFRAGSGPDGGLPYADIVALLRATHRTQQTVTRQEKERKFRPGMALATGGLINSKTTTQQVVTQTDSREQVLYVFTRSGVPWLLRERTARYAGLVGETRSPRRVSTHVEEVPSAECPIGTNLGHEILRAELSPSSLENFKTVVEGLRGRAPLANYDERLLGARSIRGINDGVAVSDLLAHLIVLDHVRRRSAGAVE
jgi:hypothetical protein